MKNMEKSHRLPLALYFVGLSISVVLMFIILPRILNDNPNTDLVPILIPGIHLAALWDIIIVYIVLPFFIILIGMLLDKLMARLLVWLHKIISLKRNEYMIIESVADLKKTGTGLVTRTLIPAFFSLSLGLLLVSMYADNLFYNPYDLAVGVDLPSLGIRDGNYSFAAVVFKFQAIFFASALTLPLTYLLFSPLWLLEDAGVTYFYKINKERKAINIQGVSRYYTGALKGFISITVIFSFLSLLYNAIQVAIASSDRAAFMILLSTVAVPLLLITFLIPGTLYHENRVAKQVPALLKKLREGKMIDYSRKELEKYLPE